MDRAKDLPPNNQSDARAEALRRVRSRLAEIDLDARSTALGLSVREDGIAVVRLLGRCLFVRPRTLDVSAEDGGPVSPVEAMLVLRFLEAEREPKPSGEDVLYRDLPGGAFYHAALAKRTTELLVRTFGNDVARLRAAVTRFPHEPLGIGDAGARVQAVGGIRIGVVYRQGDDEFPPAADLLFNRSIASVYTLDEISALATLLCVKLIKAQ